MFTKKHVFLILAIIVVAALAVACGGGSTGGGGAQNVTVTMTDFKFDPATINATVGQTVNITITNKGQTRHTWVAKDLNVNLAADPGQSASGSFKADKAGTFKVECDVPGHADQGMVGEVDVK